MPGVSAHWVSSHWALLCFVSGLLEKLHLSRNSHTDFGSYLFPWTIKAASASLQSVVCNTHCVRVFSRCASLVCFEFMCGIYCSWNFCFKIHQVFHRHICLEPETTDVPKEAKFARNGEHFKAAEMVDFNSLYVSKIWNEKSWILMSKMFS